MVEEAGLGMVAAEEAAQVTAGEGRGTQAVAEAGFQVCSRTYIRHYSRNIRRMNQRSDLLPNHRYSHLQHRSQKHCPESRSHPHCYR